MAGKKDKVKDSERFSIITEDLEHCYFCLQPAQLHEIFHGTANRKKSKEDGMVIPLCKGHHAYLHYDSELDNKIKVIGEKYWIDKYAKDLDKDAQKEMFIKRYGKNYL